MRKTVVPSDSGYLTTEGSEKTIGDVRILLIGIRFFFMIYRILGRFGIKYVK